MTIYRLKCEILSPVHIGTGAELDPLSYLIDGQVLHSVSLNNFVAGMGNRLRDEFEQVLEQANLVVVRRFLYENFRKDRDSLFAVAVTPEISHLYRMKLDDIQNQLLINPFYRCEGNMLPIVPGSTIKGALRTAVVSELANRKNIPPPQKASDVYGFEFRVLDCSDAKNDPFRGIRIRDNALKEGATIAREVKNFSKNRDQKAEANKIQMIFEVSHSEVTGENIAFETEFTFDTYLFSTRYLGCRLTWEQVVKSCTSFYRQKMEMEHETFFKGSAAESASLQLLNVPLDDNSFILRMGRFSGVESVTLDKYRKPKPPGKTNIWGTSRNLVEGKFPMGWVKMTLIGNGP